MALRSLNNRYPLGVVPVAALIIGLFFVLVLMRDAVENSENLSRAFVPLLSIVLAGLFLLAVLVFINIIKLVRRYRHQAAGSRLTARIAALFALLSLLPVGIVYYFSLGFLLRGIDSWFDVQIGRAMQDALSLSQASLDLNERVFVKYTERLLAGIEDRSTTAIALSLNTLRRQAGAIELTLYGANGQILSATSEDPTQFVPSHPEREIQQSVRDGNNYVGLETTTSDDLVIRVVVQDPTGRSSMQMQALFPTSARISELSKRLEEAYNRYTELAYLRRSLKFSFSLTLSLVLLFGLFAALIVAFHTARRLAAPIADLARATRAIALGDYEQQIPLPQHDDELAVLVSLFNTMAQRIASARDFARNSQQVAETQRNYLETVLERLSSGVVAFEDGELIRTANPAAEKILGVQFNATAWDLNQIIQVQPGLAQWVEVVRHHLISDRAWRAEVRLPRGDGGQVLLCRGSPLALPALEQQRGHVVVFDDITSLITAQRNAAWGEVARRLAHEIKNPLTPIQLSAERLRHKLLIKSDPADAQIIDRSTRTIIQQVEAMKTMVNAFSEYARAPQVQAEPLCFDYLVQEVLELYRSAGTPVLILHLGASDLQVRGDPLRLRQVLHNLIKNAQEALDGKIEGRIKIITSSVIIDDRHLVQLEVIDNGPGFEPQLLERLFEPYVTTKAKGTGLGLAIVKKIIEEHGGMIIAENLNDGARIRIQLPEWHLTIEQAQLVSINNLNN